MTISRVAWAKHQPSSKPKKYPQPQQEGGQWLLEGDYSNSAGTALFLIGFALFWGLGGPLFVLGGLRGEDGSWLSIFSLVGIVWSVIALAILWSGIKALRVSQQEKRFSRPRLLLPKPMVQPSETVRVTFQRSLKGGKLTPHPAQLHARLVQLEVTERTVGTDTVYDYHVLYEDPLASQSFSAGQSQLMASWPVFIPPTARPNVESRGHWVCWQLQVLQESPGQEPWLSQFALPIA